MKKDLTVPNIYMLEIHLTHLCNCDCPNCNMLCTQAPTTESINIEDVRVLISDSIDLAYKWEYIKLMGGEPTLYEHFEEAVCLLLDYKHSHNDSVRLHLYTNGMGSKTQKRIQWLRSKGGFEIYVDTKPPRKKPAYPHLDDFPGDIRPYLAINEAPIDKVPSKYNQNHVYVGCYSPVECGIAYNSKGFFVCSPSLAMSRVLGTKAKVKRLRDLSVEVLQGEYKTYCPYCGLYMYPGKHPVKNNEGSFVLEQTTSDSWKSLLERYNS